MMSLGLIQYIFGVGRSGLVRLGFLFLAQPKGLYYASNIIESM